MISHTLPIEVFVDDPHESFGIARGSDKAARGPLRKLDKSSVSALEPRPVIELLYGSIAVQTTATQRHRAAYHENK